MQHIQHFLLIDDDPLNNILCKVLIRHINRTAVVKSFTSSEEGFRYIEKEYAPAKDEKTLLLLDLNMPRMTGWEFMEKFQKLPENILHHFETYILSSSVDNADKEKATTNPVIKGYIEKPMRNDLLMEILS